MARVDPNEPYFLINEFLSEDKPHFDAITHELDKKTERWEEKATFLRIFTSELYKAYRRDKTRKLYEVEHYKQAEHERLTKKKGELLKKLDALKQQHATKLATTAPPQPPAVPPPAPPEPSTPTATLPNLLNDPTIHEIICPGPGQPISITKNGQEEPTPITMNEQELNMFIQELATKLHQTLTSETPFLNAPLDEHTTIQANLSTPFLKAKFVIVKG